MYGDGLVNFHDGGAVQLLIEKLHGFRLEERRDGISSLKKKGRRMREGETDTAGRRAMIEGWSDGKQDDIPWLMNDLANGRLDERMQGLCEDYRERMEGGEEERDSNG